MCKELHVTLKESPIPIYKTFEELTNDDFEKIGQSLFPWNWVVDERMNFLNASREEKEKIIRDSTNAYKNVLNEATRAVIQDVDNFVKSYNYHDCSMFSCIENTIVTGSVFLPVSENILIFIH